MIADSKQPSFESSFNDWYKKFLELEKELSEKVKEAKKHKDEKIENARKEALELIKNYEQEQRDNLEAAKAKLQVSLGKGEDIDKKNKKELDDIQAQYKANKGKVIEFLIENVLDVQLELPESVKRKSAKK